MLLLPTYAQCPTHPKTTMMLCTTAPSPHPLTRTAPVWSVDREALIFSNLEVNYGCNGLGMGLWTQITGIGLCITADCVPIDLT